MTRTALAVGISLLATAAWTPQATGVTARLRGVSAASEHVVWASGTGGTVLRTADGGATWTRLTVPDSGRLDFRDIDAVSETSAYALSIGSGAASRIYKTTDSGATWTLQLTNDDPKAFFDAMTFCDAAHGFTMSDSVDGHFVVLRTTDGRTWSRVPDGALPAALPNEGAFAASGTNIAMHGCQHAWIGTGAAGTARVLRTTDGGGHWEVSSTPLASGPSSGVFSIAFVDDAHGIVVGGDYRQERQAVDNVATTSDGGVTWQLQRGLSGFRSAVGVMRTGPNTPVYVAVGPQGTDLSSDFGRTWSAVDGPGFHTLTIAPGQRLAWGAGEKGSAGLLTLQPAQR